MIATQLGDGDYYEALGVHWNSAPTDIAVAAAKLAGEHPEEARRINAVASALRDPRQREIYLIAREERDNVLRQLLDLSAAVPDLRSRIWMEIQRLLRSEFELGEVRIGPRGARSLAQRHEWVKEAVVNSAFPILTPSPAERRAGMAYRTLVTQCPKCDGAAPEYCDCQDTYRFDIPSGAPPGTQLGAYGDQTGRFSYMILDRAAVSPRPYNAMNAIYMVYRMGERMGGSGNDLTLEEGQAWYRKNMRVAAVFLALFGVLVGLLTSTWQIGLIAVAAGLAIPAVKATITPDTARMSWPVAIAWLLVQPIAGALAGSALATTTSGLITGLIVSGVLLVAVLLLRRVPT
jgi:hypothetical protein